MPRKVSDHIVERLQEWGVERIFGYSGDGINGIIGALDRAGNTPRFIQSAHEELAALMACAHAKFTGQVGVCLATQGPGAIHLLNGLYDARSDHQPVVAVVGQQSTTAMGGEYQQEIDLLSLFKDVAGAYVQMVTSPAQVRHVIDRAFRIALAERTVTCIIVPHDIQDEEAIEQPPHEHGAMHSGVGWSAPRVLPTDADLARAAEVLNAGRRPAILIGAGALAATDEVIAVAEKLGAGVAKALLGKAALPDDLPFVTGSVGWLGTRASNEMLAECDTLLMVGTSFPYIEYYPKPGQAKCVQIELDPKRIGLRHPVDAALVGDSARVLRLLLPRLDHQQDRAFLGTAQKGMAEWRELMQERGTRTDTPMKPQVVAHELNKLLSDDAILATDSGTITTWIARHVDMRGNMMFSCSGNLATMACALPYANAAAIAYPGRQVICFIGDGGFSMLMCELATAVKYGLDVKIVVISNDTLGQIKWEQMVFLGNPEYGCDCLLYTSPSPRDS